MEQVPNQDRSYEVLVTPCIVTKKFDKCIRVELGRVVMPDGVTAIIKGAFSKDGLHSLLADLESIEDPLNLPTPDHIRVNALYHWGVVMKDGEHYQQYGTDGSEKPFAEINIPEVQEFWIIPRHDPNGLPWFGLIRGVGFVTRKDGSSGIESLDVPIPDEEFWFQYYRNMTLHFGIIAGHKDVLPPRIVQVLGWRVGDVICEIGIEEDGNWQVWKQEPLAYFRGSDG